MRIAGFILALFLPVFAHAAPPSLTTYTVSHDTIYPSATAGSGFATTTSIDTAFSEQVKVSIKIMSAGGGTVKSLYSSSGVTNPAPKIWDGMNTAGIRVDNGTYTILISATSTATSLTMTDSSKTVIVASSDSTSPDTSSDSITTATTAPQSGAPPEYIPIPTLRIVTNGSRSVSSSADTAFTAVVYDGKGNKRNDALVTWSFGDGMRRTGASVFHTYYEPGEYLAVVHASTPDGGDALAEIVMTVKDAHITIDSVSSRGIALVNRSVRTLDLSLWRLLMGGKEFKIPEDTQILAGRTVLFSSRVLQLPPADSAFLLYPNGEVAATYPAVATAVQVETIIMQPSSAVVSYEKVQAITQNEATPLISKQTNFQTHEEAVGAPTTAIELAAVGAVLPVSRASGIFKSPWTYGFLGVIALAGAAFIFL
ncbi:MAG: PKD domain-containing protein [Patescibacteria group bacterium]